ncbi:hypothetical protein ACNKHK_03080 [Shigella flexneri]
MEEYQQYRESEAWQRDAAFWAEQRRQLPPPASLLRHLAGRSAADILHLNWNLPTGNSASWLCNFQVCSVPI